MKIKYLPESERPVEKLGKYGVESLSNNEILAVIINSGTVDKSAINLADEIICRLSNDISDLKGITLSELMEIKGIGETKAARILAAVELHRRLTKVGQCSNGYISNDDDVAALVMEELRHEKKEHFLAVLLTTKGQVIEIDKVSMGELSSTVVHPREVFKMAIKRSAASVILVHNHPSGDPTPSQEDIKTTVRLVECGILLGIRVLDHVIIGDGRHTSIRSSCNLKIFGGNN